MAKRVYDDAFPLLDMYQKAAFDAVVERRENVFITGPAGSGKSFTIRAIVAALQARGLRVAVCSSTGRSAVELQLDATTLHGFLAMGDTGDNTVKYYTKRLRSEIFELYADYIRRADVLVIDEISMVSSEFLARCEGILSSVRNKPNAPWGDLQVIFSGDFMQLRPVPKRPPIGYTNVIRLPRPQFAFTAIRAWTGSDVKTFNLVDLHRQSGDATYGELLNRMRFNMLRPEDVTLLRSRIISRSRAKELESVATFIYSRNDAVDEHNKIRLSGLDVSTRRTFTCSMKITCKLNAKRPQADIIAGATKYITDSMRALPSIELRIGARVILLANVDVSRGLATSTAGTIIGYDEETRMPVVKFDDIVEPEIMTLRTWKFAHDPEWLGTYEQVPLMLAWASSAHRSQGLTLKCIVASASPADAFEPGMVYVVCSRVKELAHLHFLPGFSSAAIYCDRQAREFYLGK